MAPDNNSQLEEATEKNKCPVLPGGSAQSKKKKISLTLWGDHHGIRRLKGHDWCPGYKSEGGNVRVKFELN